MKRSRLLAVLPFLAALGLAGCGGSASTAPAVPPSQNAGSAGDKTSIAFTIVVPKTAAGTSQRRRQYVSVNTQSVAIQQLAAASPYKPVGNPVVANITPTSPGCSSNTIQTTCTFDFTAAPGTFNVSVQSYAGLDGGGALLAENTLATATIVAGVVNALSVTLNGVIGSVALPNSVAGTLSAPQTVSFTVQDATGATIVGAGTYDNGPLMLSDATGLTTISPASFAAPSNSSSFSLQCTSSGNGTIEFADSSGSLASLSYSCSADTISLSPGSLDFDALAGSSSDPTYDRIVTVSDGNLNVESQTPMLSCVPGKGSTGGTVALAISAAPEMWAIRPLDVGTCTFFVEDQFSGGVTQSSQTISIEIQATSYTVDARTRTSHARR